MFQGKYRKRPHRTDSLLYKVFIFLIFYSAFPTEPNNSIFSFTVALIASAPGANNLRGSNPLPSRSLPASIYLRVASANTNWHSVLTLTLETPKVIAF